MKIKKFFAIIFTLIILVSLCSCSSRVYTEKPKFLEPCIGCYLASDTWNINRYRYTNSDEFLDAFEEKNTWYYLYDSDFKYEDILVFRGESLLIGKRSDFFNSCILIEGELFEWTKKELVYVSKTRAITSFRYKDYFYENVDYEDCFTEICNYEFIDEEVEKVTLEENFVKDIGRNQKVFVSVLDNSLLISRNSIELYHGRYKGYPKLLKKIEIPYPIKKISYTTVEHDDFTRFITILSVNCILKLEITPNTIDYEVIDKSYYKLDLINGITQPGWCIYEKNNNKFAGNGKFICCLDDTAQFDHFAHLAD